MRRFLTALGVALSAIGLAAGVAYAHSGVAASNPGRDVTVGGEITEIRIFYGDIILAFDATVTLRSTGEEVGATAEMTSDIEGVITLDEPLAIEGEYEVNHTITSFDDDVVDDDYRFTYEVGGPPARLIFVEDDDGGLSPIVWIVAGVGTVVILVLAVRLVLSLRRRSAAVPRSD